MLIDKGAFKTEIFVPQDVEDGDELPNVHLDCGGKRVDLSGWYNGWTDSLEFVLHGPKDCTFNLMFSSLRGKDYNFKTECYGCLCGMENGEAVCSQSRAISVPLKMCWQSVVTSLPKAQGLVFGHSKVTTEKMTKFIVIHLEIRVMKGTQSFDLNLASKVPQGRNLMTLAAEQTKANAETFLVSEENVQILNKLGKKSYLVPNELPDQDSASGDFLKLGKEKNWNRLSKESFSLKETDAVVRRGVPLLSNQVPSLPLEDSASGDSAKPDEERLVNINRTVRSVSILDNSGVLKQTVVHKEIIKIGSRAPVTITRVHTATTWTFDDGSTETFTDRYEHMSCDEDIEEDGEKSLGVEPVLDILQIPVASSREEPVTEVFPVPELQVQQEQPLDLTLDSMSTLPETVSCSFKEVYHVDLSQIVVQKTIKAGN